MYQSKITTRYAKALLILAKEKNLAHTIKKNIELIYDSISNINEIPIMLKNPTIPPSKKQQAFNKIFQDKICPLCLDFFSIIFKNNREEYILDIARNYITLYKQDKGIKTITITSSKKLSPELKDKIIKTIKNKLQSEIELCERVDKSIIGGFILRIDDMQYDASISKKLKDIKQQLIQKRIKGA